MKLFNNHPRFITKEGIVLKNTQSNYEGTDEKITTDDSITYLHKKYCLGDSCSIYGMSFGECVTKIFPIDNIQIEDMLECHFTE